MLDESCCDLSTFRLGKIWFEGFALCKKIGILQLWEEGGRNWWSSGTDVGRNGVWLWATSCNPVPDFVWIPGYPHPHSIAVSDELFAFFAAPCLSPWTLPHSQDIRTTQTTTTVWPSTTSTVSLAVMKCASIKTHQYAKRSNFVSAVDCRGIRFMCNNNSTHMIYILWPSHEKWSSMNDWHRFLFKKCEETRFGAQHFELKSDYTQCCFSPATNKVNPCNPAPNVIGKLVTIYCKVASSKNSTVMPFAPV